MEKLINDFSISLFLWQVFVVAFWVAIILVIIRFVKRYRKYAGYYRKNNP
jgi:hypothetical protein